MTAVAQCECGAVRRCAQCRCPNCVGALCAAGMANAHEGVCGRCWSRGCTRAQPNCNVGRVYRAEPFEDAK